jgi:hypothetical protein
MYYEVFWCRFQERKFVTIHTRWKLRPSFSFQHPQTIYKLLLSLILLAADDLCDPVPTVPNATPNTSLCLPNTTVSYACDEGYEYSLGVSLVRVQCIRQNWTWLDTPDSCRGLYSTDKKLVFFCLCKNVEMLEFLLLDLVCMRTSSSQLSAHIWLTFKVVTSCFGYMLYLLKRLRFQ